MKTNLTFDVIEEVKTTIKWKRKTYIKTRYNLKEYIKLLFKKATL